MARRRFIAPARDAVPGSAFEHPAFAPYAAHFDLLRAPDWPALDALNERLGGAVHAATGVPLRFVAQTQALLADGLHYERRVHDRGAIATRERNWHDLLNALVWLAFGSIKAAMNLRQVEEIDRAPTGRRTRAQDALTQFDEAGAIVSMRDTTAVEPWDRHDWVSLFTARRPLWLDGRIEVAIVGHALLEHLLAGRDDLVAKALVSDGPAHVPSIAAAIADGRALDDPQSARPLPLCGIPGWHPANNGAAFYEKRTCFAPARSGNGIRSRGAPIAG